MASPVWHLAGHLSLKSSPQQEPGPTGETTLTSYPYAHGSISFLFSAFTSCCCYSCKHGFIPPSFFLPAQKLRDRATMPSVTETVAGESLVRNEKKLCVSVWKEERNQGGERDS